MNSLPPLAERMRPKTLGDFVGQSSILNSDSILIKALNSGQIPSLILWGPPGCGKTTLAKILAKETGREFFSISAVNIGVKEIREIIESSKKGSIFSKGAALVFIDEIHRFNKSQQDSLLEAVEKGWIILLGATTENPSFEIIPALLSRCQVLILKSLEKADLEKLLFRALKTDALLSKKNIELLETEGIIALSDGDARRMLNILEMICMTRNEESSPFKITNKYVEDLLAKNPLAYDKSGDLHYDSISAFIKSVRGSDPNASLYWLARMIASGENPLFIARRLIVLASEDIGNANPFGLVMANACFQAVHAIGMPEARLILSQTTLLLTNSQKSNAAYMGIESALKHVGSHPAYSVPIHLRNAPTELMKTIGNGEDYMYPHDYPENFHSQEYLPSEISGTVFYVPGENLEEQEMKQRMENRWGNKYS